MSMAFGTTLKAHFMPEAENAKGNLQPEDNELTKKPARKGKGRKGAASAAE